MAILEDRLGGEKRFSFTSQAVPSGTFADAIQDAPIIVHQAGTAMLG